MLNGLMTSVRIRVSMSIFVNLWKSERRERLAMYKHGLIAGNFFPLHRGHMHLIETAQEQCERVTVFLVEGLDQNPDVTLRHKWLTESFPSIRIVTVCDLFSNDADPASNIQ